MFVFVTEHDYGKNNSWPDSPPESSSSMLIGKGSHITSGSDIPTGYIIRGVFSTYEQAKIEQQR